MTSFGRGCGRPKFPGVYVEVPAVLDFVTDPDPVFAPIPRIPPREDHREAAGRASGSRCDEGPWTGEDIEFKYFWYGGFHPRPQSRRRSFVPGRALAGKQVSCAVIAANDGGLVELVSRPVRVHDGGR